MLLLQIFVILWSFNAIAAQTAEIGSCPEVRVVEQLQVEKFMGTWYELSRSLPNTFEPNTECVTFNYTLDDRNFIRILVRQFSNETRLESQYFGNATIDTDACEDERPLCGKLKAAYLKPDGTTYVGPLWILAIHYNSFAVLWSCTEFNNGQSHSKRAWVIGKIAHPADSLIDGVHQALKDNNLTDIEFEKTKQHTFCSSYYRQWQETE